MVPPASHRVSRVPWYSGSCSLALDFAYGAFTLFGLLSQSSSAINYQYGTQSATPTNIVYRFGLFPFRSPLLRKSIFSFSSCRYLDVSVHGVSLPYPIYSAMDDWAFPSQVSPFGYLRIDTYLRFPAAFRSLSRPSSASGAKAFPLCSFLLDRLIYLYISECSSDTTFLSLP